MPGTLFNQAVRSCIFIFFRLLAAAIVTGLIFVIRLLLRLLLRSLVGRAGSFFVARTPQLEAIEAAALAADFVRSGESSASGSVGPLRIYEQV